jgi:hypothetical protein
MNNFNSYTTLDLLEIVERWSPNSIRFKKEFIESLRNQYVEIKFCSVFTPLIKQKIQDWTDFTIDQRKGLENIITKWKINVSAYSINVY